jgi:hypothetical protein
MFLAKVPVDDAIWQDRRPPIILHKGSLRTLVLLYNKKAALVL